MISYTCILYKNNWTITAVVCLSNTRKPHKTKTPMKPFENVLFFFLKTEKNGTEWIVVRVIVDLTHELLLFRNDSGSQFVLQIF